MQKVINTGLIKVASSVSTREEPESQNCVKKHFFANFNILKFLWRYFLSSVFESITISLKHKYVAIFKYIK